MDGAGYHATANKKRFDYNRPGHAIHQFLKETLPSPQSNLAQQAKKDPYLFDFLKSMRDDI